MVPAGAVVSRTGSELSDISFVTEGSLGSPLPMYGSLCSTYDPALFVEGL